MTRENDPNDSRVVITGGWVHARDFVSVSAHPCVMEGLEFTRMYTLRGGRWSHFDLDGRMVRTVLGAPGPERTVICLDRRGALRVETEGGVVTEEQIGLAGTGPGKLGYLNQLRLVGGTLHACGFQGQLYRRGKSRWRWLVDRDKAPAEVRELALYSLDGTSEDDLYACGERGVLWHWDGEHLTQLDSPSSRDLNWVRCVSPDEVYLCGNHGGFFRGSRAGWEDLSLDGLERPFWCVEVFEGKPYLAASTGLHVFDGKEVVPVDTGIDPRPGGHRLHAADGVLWSFGLEDLVFFDGKKWERVDHPDNV